MKSRSFFGTLRKSAAWSLRFTEGRTFLQNLADEMFRSALERQAEIIGEALKQATDLDPSLSERIHDFRAIITFRNRLVNGYGDVSSELVWDIATKDVPRLLAEIRTLMTESNRHARPRGSQLTEERGAAVGCRLLHEGYGTRNLLLPSLIFMML